MVNFSIRSNKSRGSVMVSLESTERLVFTILVQVQAAAHPFAFFLSFSLFVSSITFFKYNAHPNCLLELQLLKPRALRHS